MKFSRKQVLFVAIFGVLALVADRINVASVMGAPGQTFTLFQFFGPVAGAFLGAWLGIAAVLGAELVNFVLLGKAVTAINVLRLFPMLFATWYFAKGKDTKAGIAVPLAAMALFWLNPIGLEAWPYALYWLIPVIARIFFKENLFAKSLGTTFTAHSVGSVAFLYTTGMAAPAWMALIPQVAIERLLFGAGIAFSFVVMNSLLAALTSRWKLKFLTIEPRYALHRA
jgi:hypothetical protein